MPIAKFLDSGLQFPTIIRVDHLNIILSIDEVVDGKGAIFGKSRLARVHIPELRMDVFNDQCLLLRLL